MLTPLLTIGMDAAESGRLPDSLVRVGIRRLLRGRASMLQNMPVEQSQQQLRAFIADCSQSRIAEVPEKANEQHYEVPTEFFRGVLGPHLKYSCCHWSEATPDLAAAEAAALQQTCERAGINNGMKILELGCGWGSLSLWMAQHYPESQIVAVSNSKSQRDFILSQAAERGVTNLNVMTADMNEFCPGEQTFDRVVSVEMFEHMRNHAELLRRVSQWLVPGGRLFVHIFCHRSHPYLYEDKGPQDWMTRYFFSGGMMPSDHLLLHYQRDLNLVNQWRWSGQHYEQTCNAWLARCDEQRERVLSLFSSTYGANHAQLWFQRWRIFFMACAELFGYRDGNEWWISHYVFEKPQ